MDMNRLLSSSLGVVNAFLAIGIIAVGVRTGLWEGETTFVEGGKMLGGIVGGVLGVIAATLVCGIVATMIDIRNTLREILEELKRRSG
jgi:hypothetical protein